MPDNLSIKETADKLDISAASVRALMKKGELEGAFQSPRRAWLISAEAVSAYKAARREKPRSPTDAYFSAFAWNRFAFLPSAHYQITLRKLRLISFRRP